MCDYDDGMREYTRTERPSSVEEQAIFCTVCGAHDYIRSDDERTQGYWPAWPPGYLPNYCPTCGNGCWAASPRKAH